MRSVEFKVVNAYIYLTAFRRKLRLKSDHGSTDEIHVYVEGGTVYTLTMNARHGYVGLASFVKDDILANGVRKDGWWLALPTSDIFLDNNTQIVEVAGKKGMDLSPVSLVRRLREYLPYE